MMLIKDLMSGVNPNLSGESQPNVRNTVMREPNINPNLIPRFSDVPVLHLKTHNTIQPVCKEERNGCMRRNSDATVN